MTPFKRKIDPSRLSKGNENISMQDIIENIPKTITPVAPSQERKLQPKEKVKSTPNKINNIKHNNDISENNNDKINQFTQMKHKFIFPGKIFNLIKEAILANDKPLIVGPPGCGKSIVPEKIFEILKIFHIRKSLGNVSDPSELIGNTHVFSNNGSSETRFVGGLLTQAAINGWGLILDEFDTATPAANMALHQITEENGQLIIHTEKGIEVITPHKNFRIVFTANTWGTGNKNGLFANARRQNTAFLLRIGPKFEMDYSESIEKNILLERGLPANVINDLYLNNGKNIGIISMIRKACKDGEINGFLSFRSLLRFADYYHKFGWHIASQVCIVNDFEEEFRDTIIEIICKSLGNEFKPTMDEDMINKNAPILKSKGYGTEMECICLRTKIMMLLDMDGIKNGIYYR